MTSHIAYNYAILRYIHDITTGEFINIGVVLYAPEVKFIDAICNNTCNRVAKIFPDVNASHLKSIIDHIQIQFKRYGEKFQQSITQQLAEFESLSYIMHHILPVDDSSLQWSPIGVGLTSDPKVTLGDLFERMVMRYDFKSKDENDSMMTWSSLPIDGVQ